MSAGKSSIPETGFRASEKWPKKTKRTGPENPGRYAFGGSLVLLVEWLPVF
jgi:hypothetical protein